MKRSATEIILLVLIAACSWLAVLTQFYEFMMLDVLKPIERVLYFFSFFTIDTIILIAIWATLLLAKPTSLSSSASIQTALTVYIFIVSIIYNLMLRTLWNPEGMQRVADELFHLVIPVLYLIYWWKYCRKEILPMKVIWKWQLFPLLYLLYVIVKGYLFRFFPYPFLNMKELSYREIAVNISGLTLLFILCATLFWWMENRLAKRSKI